LFFFFFFITHSLCRECTLSTLLRISESHHPKERLKSLL
jgi:hypothetical protein